MFNSKCLDSDLRNKGHDYTSYHRAKHTEHRVLVKETPSEGHPESEIIQQSQRIVQS